MPETFTIVAFKYTQKRSILYQNTQNPECIGRIAEKALKELGADVISIRRVKTET